MEFVGNCPYCGGTENKSAYGEVQDWAFSCAPGWWSYLDCTGCGSLYLHQRLMESSIGKAYASYYTHGQASHQSATASLKQRLRNEVWSHAMGVSIPPRLNLPSWAGRWLKPLQASIVEPFGLRQMAQQPKGLLIDVGCGDGQKLELASNLGWQAIGLELDSAAVKAARARGLQVREGGYALLANYAGQADCLVCSHVLEHVHQPLQLLHMLLLTLKHGGVLLLSTPNASSYLRHHYGANWRGLEAPRHLAIASSTWLQNWLEGRGLQCTQAPSFDLECAVESERIARRVDAASVEDVRSAKQLLARLPKPTLVHQDATQLVCIKAVP
jgi:2-polyprenyl-3-methyl-5-hydroxy-6-metoxy-1,4-benzoquinol methylase